MTRQIHRDRWGKITYFDTLFMVPFSLSNQDTTGLLFLIIYPYQSLFGIVIRLFFENASKCCQ